MRCCKQTQQRIAANNTAHRCKQNSASLQTKQRIAANKQNSASLQTNKTAHRCKQTKQRIAAVAQKPTGSHRTDLAPTARAARGRIRMCASRALVRPPGNPLCTRAAVGEAEH
jgi:hypothetical protein